MAIERKWDIQLVMSWYFQCGFHVDHSGPSITLHLPCLILAVGRLEQPGFRRTKRQVGKIGPEDCMRCISGADLDEEQGSALSPKDLFLEALSEGRVEEAVSCAKILLGKLVVEIVRE